MTVELKLKKHRYEQSYISRMIDDMEKYEYEKSSAQCTVLGQVTQISPIIIFPMKRMFMKI